MKQRLFLIAGPLAVAALVTACGGGSSNASSTTSTTRPGTGAFQAAFAKYTTCLEGQGVPASVATARFGRRGQAAPSTAPGQTFTRPTVPAQYAAAYSACRSDLPTGGLGANSAATAAYRNCLITQLQIRGVTIPTTTTVPGGPSRGGGFGGGQLAGLANNPAFASAQKACASLRPARSSTSSSVPSA